MKQAELLRAVILAAALAVAGGGMGTARADVMYDFTYTVTIDLAGGTNLSGVFDVSGTTVVGITGTSSLYGAITSLLLPDTFAANDNQLSTTAPYVDSGGISFTLASGGNANLYMGGLGLDEIA